MKKLLLNLTALICSAFVFTSCLGVNDDGTNEPGQVITVTTGLFVLNEGNMFSQIPGSLSYLDYSNATMTNNLFRTLNGRSLGGTPNSIELLGNSVFIACTDENRVEVTTASLHSTTSIEIKTPRELATDGKYIYVTNYEGVVTKIDAETNKIVGTSQVIGGNLEGIAYANKTLYVCNAYNDDYSYNDKIIKLNSETLEKTGEITVAVNPTKIRISGKTIYVLSSGNYVDVTSQIQSIDENENVQYVCDATHFCVSNDDLYVINSVMDWSENKAKNEYFEISKGTRSNLKLNQEIDFPCSIAVDTKNGLLFIGAYPKGSTGMQDFSGAGTLYLSDLNGGNSRSFAVGVGPTTLCLVNVSYVYY